MLQAAGRCNREGRIAQGGDVHIFHGPTEPPPGPLLQSYQVCEEMLCAHGGQLDADNAALLRHYFSQRYQQSQEYDRAQLLATLNGMERPENFPFRSFADKFRLIRDDTQAFYVYYRESDSLLQNLAEQGPDRALLRQLQRYQLRVYPHQFEHWCELGLIRPVFPQAESHEQQLWQESQPGTLYCPRYGLQPEKQFVGVEQLII